MIRVGLYTLGCKVSQYETEAIAEGFIAAGAAVCPFSERNDIYVINTCTVTAESDRKSRQFIRRAINKNPDATVAVLGCYSQRSPDEVAGIEGVDIVIGTDGKLAVIDLALKAHESKKSGAPCEKTVMIGDVWHADFEPMRIVRAPRTRAYVKIEDGCESKCTYCAISDARGRVRSKDRESALSEVKALFDSGIAEVVLTGIETGSYGRDFDIQYGLADLICELDAICPEGRIRLGSLSPELIGRDFVERVSDVRILLPHFHLSVQSGSNDVLRRMKRRYTRERALENIERLGEAYPTANFTTDLMVGFPGETETDFLDTCDFVDKAEFIDAHVFAYSRRKNTPAYYYENQIPEDVKRDRSDRLIRYKNRVRDRLLAVAVERAEPINLIAESLTDDGFIAAHSDSFIELRLTPADLSACPNDLIGKWLRAMPVSHKDGILYCKQII